MPDQQGNSIHTLIGDALRESTDLARKEMALFRTEMTENIRGLVMGLAMFVGAAVFAVVAISLLVQSLVDWLAKLLNSDALAALIVGVVMAAIAIGLALYGKSKVSPSALAPTRTVRNLRRDTEVISERVSA